jgi:hypothetical protein
MRRPLNRGSIFKEIHVKGRGGGAIKNGVKVGSLKVTYLGKLRREGRKEGVIRLKSTESTVLH